MFYLVEAKEVLDGGGGVEDVAFSRHHQHEAIQRLKTKKKNSVTLNNIIKIYKITLITLHMITWSSRSPSEKLTPSREVTWEEGEEAEEGAEVVEDGGSAVWPFPPNIRLRSLVQLEPFWPFFRVAAGEEERKHRMVHVAVLSEEVKLPGAPCWMKN